jgi:hypothetical protein
MRERKRRPGNKSRRNTGNEARADRRKTEIEKEPFATQKQKAEKQKETVSPSVARNSETERRERAPKLRTEKSK